MSVFRLHEWWSIQIAQGEEFDQGCLCIGNLDNARPPSDKVCVGSLQGMLRVYNPSHPGYKVEDLVLEEDLGQPVLQVLAGRFIPSTNLLALAVLHPTKLAVFEIVSGPANSGGSGAAKASFFSLQKSYTHDLGIDGKHFSAHNMASGLFGGILGREMLIVQSLDGKLQIFDQSALAFTRQFIDCLVPGPLAYLPRLDAFVTVNHATHAICYRYQVIASAQTDLGHKASGSRDRDAPQAPKGGPGSQAAEVTGAFGLTAVRSAMVEWDTLLGEHCRQILDGAFSPAAAQVPPSDAHRAGEKSKEPGGELLLLCDRSLFVVRESGAVLQQRLLDKSPACCCAYRAPGAAGHNVLLAYHDGTLQVYSQFQLAWAAKADKAPVHIAVGDFGPQKGLIVQLDDSGRLSLSYLGTKPPQSVASSALSRELDYDKVEEDHRALLHVIRESQTERRSEPKDKLLIRCQLPRTLDLEPTPSDAVLPDGLVWLQGGSSQRGLVKATVRVFLSYTGTQAATDVTLSVRGPPFTHVEPHTLVIKSVSGARATPTTVKLTFYASAACLPTGLEAELCACYTSTAGEPRVASHRFLLPLFLACRPKHASKSAQHKLTIDTALPAQPLTALFDDVLYAAAEAGQDVAEALGSTAAQAMGFELWAGAETGGGGGGDGPASVSILVSKTAGRYRVQSDCLPALHIVMAELERRLGERLAKLDAPSTRLVTCSDFFPFAEYFAAIEGHFATRLQLRGLYSRLNDAAHLFRVVQKKLLARFKDKNPSPLAGLDVLLRETHARILLIADEAEALQRQLVRRSLDVSCLSRLLVQVTALRLALPAASRALLEAYLCTSFRETSGGSDEHSGTGWEEQVDAAMTFLLKTLLAKQPKEAGQLSAPIDLPEDLEPLKKHIAVVFDRLEKGASLALPSGGGGDDGEAREESRQTHK